MAPVFIPMFMLLGYTPELTQTAYRIGDSTTNIIAPMMSYFALIVAFFERYDKRSGIGTVVATRKDPSLEGLRLTVVQPLDENGAEVDRPLVAVDTGGQAAIGEHVFYVTGADAMMVSTEPRPLLPVDAAVVGILHEVYTPLARRRDEASGP